MGGYSGVNFGHPKSEVFQNGGGGGYSGVNFGHPKSEVFQNGGIFRSKLWSSQIWSFPKWGGYSGVNFGHPKSEVFQNGGGGLSGLKFQKGAFWKNLGKNLLFSQKPACAWQIVSHILRMRRLISAIAVAYSNPLLLVFRVNYFLGLTSVTEGGDWNIQLTIQ